MPSSRASWRIRGRLRATPLDKEEPRTPSSGSSRRRESLHRPTPIGLEWGHAHFRGVRNGSGYMCYLAYAGLGAWNLYLC
jgi:hypothetical protein